MTLVVTTNKDKFAESHVFEDFGEALAYAALRYDEEYIQSIGIFFDNIKIKEENNK